MEWEEFGEMQSAIRVVGSGVERVALNIFIQILVTYCGLLLYPQNIQKNKENSLIARTIFQFPLITSQSNHNSLQIGFTFYHFYPNASAQKSKIFPKWPFTLIYSLNETQENHLIDWSPILRKINNFRGKTN